MNEDLYTGIFQIIQEQNDNKLAAFDGDFIRRRIERKMHQTFDEHQGAYLTYLQNNPSEAEALYQSFFITYSTFFRNPYTFLILEKFIFPQILREHQHEKRNEIRIWSAACAAGQEPYSLAILLEQLKENVSSTLPYRIFATDQSNNMLEKARRGSYHRENLQNLPLKFFDQWFTPNKGNEYQIDEKLSGNIDFSNFDLLNNEMECPAASIFGNFDMVCCANLLIYYKDEMRKRIIGKLIHCLKPGGFLVCDESEREYFFRYGLKEIHPECAIFQKKP